MEAAALQKPRVVIVGAGFGGLEAAKKLACEKVRVTVIDRTNYHLFQPLLYQVATAALSPADIAALPDLATVGAEADGVFGNRKVRFDEANALPPIPDLEVVALIL